MAGVPVTDPLPKPAAPRPSRLDHDLYDPPTRHPAGAVGWPAGRSVASFVLIHVESLEIDPPADAVREPRLRGEFGSFHPDLRGHSLFEYGLRIGLFRLLDLLQARGWTVAAAVNGLVAEEKPTLVRRLRDHGVEVLASAWSASRMVTGAMPADIERAMIARSVDAIASATGSRPTGWASQDYGHSMRTAALLAEAGFDHAVDWPNDERPFSWGPGRTMVMLPVAAELDDAQAMQARRVQPHDWAAALHAALRWWSEEAPPGALFALPLHAAVAGAAHRARALERALRDVDPARFWQASPSEIAKAWRERQGNS